MGKSEASTSIVKWSEVWVGEVLNGKIEVSTSEVIPDMFHEAIFSALKTRTQMQTLCGINSTYYNLNSVLFSSHTEDDHMSGLNTLLVTVH